MTPFKAKGNLGFVKGKGGRVFPWDKVYIHAAFYYPPSFHSCFWPPPALRFSQEHLSSRQLDVVFTICITKGPHHQSGVDVVSKNYVNTIFEVARFFLAPLLSPTRSIICIRNAHHQYFTLALSKVTCTQFTVNTMFQQLVVSQNRGKTFQIID